MRIIRRFSVLIALISAVALLAQGSAYAAPNAVAAAITGQGTISPGLNTLPAPQFVTFGGTAVGVIIAVPGASAGTYSCTFSGGSSNVFPPGGDSLAAGMGTVTGGCSGGTVGTGSVVPCVVIYIRVGSIVVIIFTCATSASGPTGSGSGNGTGVGVFLFVPDQVTPPVTSYRLAGVAAGAGAA
ncbi:MAG: hypothetical protein QOK43_891 [Acidimicrobiaceae bacterium]|nr:hypothetical protein [Acidimicrobiaceae bacterium]